ncbi:MAG: DNA-binding protein [Bacteroidetes bacterium]|nr:DNA-binding protein [Bacteroidota bacterium]
MIRKPYIQGRVFVGRLPGGVDLVAAITHIANEEGIKLASVSAYGILNRVALTQFDAENPLAAPVQHDEPMEIASLSGTISQFKGRSMARLNGVFVPKSGMPIGGSVALGTMVHACEVVISELEGATLSRDFDMETGLPLWKESSLLIERPNGSA